MSLLIGDELLKLCASNDLSFDTLQEKINAIGPRLSSQTPLCFHKACSNKKVTLKIVQLLHNTFPEAQRLRDNYRVLPIHMLCCNRNMDDTASIDILRFMLNIDSTLPSEMGGIYGCLPIQLAVKYKSTAFCKILIDAYPESLRIESHDGWLSIHSLFKICDRTDKNDPVDIIKYMLEVDPELIHARANGSLPIHLAANRKRLSLMLLLSELENFPNAASKEVNDGTRRLPLHLACATYNPLPISIFIQIWYDAYPEAIFARDRDGRTPLDIARSNENRNQSEIEFLQTQLVYAELLEVLILLEADPPDHSQDRASAVCSTNTYSHNLKH